MLKKLAFATGVAALALSPALASPESDENLDVAVEEAVAGDYGMVSTGEDELLKALNPFAGMENFALKKPLIELPKPDPARLAAADQVLGKLMADGTYARVMAAMQKDTLQPLFDRMWTMKASEFMDMLGLPETPGMPADKKDETFADAMVKDDPHGKERIEAYMTAYFQLLGDMVGAVEPDIRSAMARDFARRYDVAQLEEMNRFFATPAGAAFARDYMTSSFTIDVLQTSLMVWPKMVKKVPDFAERLLKADAHLPPRPKTSPVVIADDLSPKCAQDGDSGDCTDEDWADAYIEKSSAERDAWSAKDRRAVEKAEAKRDKAQDALNAQYKKLDATEATLSDLIYAARTNAGQDVDIIGPPIMVVPPPIEDAPAYAPPGTIQ